MENDNHIKIIDVYYVPGVAKHLLSVGQATNNGLTIEFTENRAMIHLHKGKSKAIVCPRPSISCGNETNRSIANKGMS